MSLPFGELPGSRCHDLRLRRVVHAAHCPSRRVELSAGVTATTESNESNEGVFEVRGLWCRGFNVNLFFEGHSWSLPLFD